MRQEFGYGFIIHSSKDLESTNEKWLLLTTYNNKTPLDKAYAVILDADNKIVNKEEVILGLSNFK